jgi:protein kinase/serine/threonine-protein kinase
MPTANITAYDHFLKGNEYNDRWADGEKQDNVKAITHFKKAIALDPDYALAWAGLGYAYNLSTYYGLGEAWRDSAIVACKKAIAVDPNCGFAYNILGLVSYFRGRYTEAHKFYEKASGSIPSMLYLVTGKLVEAVIASKKGISRNPLNHFGYMLLGETYRLLDDPVQAEQWLNKAMELKSYNQTIFYSAKLNLSEGRDDRSREQMHEIIAMEDQPRALSRAAVIARLLGDFSLAKKLNEKAGSASVSAGFILLKTGQHEEAEKILNRIHAAFLTGSTRVLRGAGSRLQMANLHAIRGDKAEAFKWLQRWIDAGGLEYRLFLRDSMWEDLRGEVRFQELMSQMKTKIDSMRRLVEELE